LRRHRRWALRSRGRVRGRLRRPRDAPLEGKRFATPGCLAIEGGGTHPGVKRRVSSSMSNDSRNAAAASICFDSVSFAICSVGIRRNYSFSVTVFFMHFCIVRAQPREPNRWVGTQPGRPPALSINSRSCCLPGAGRMDLSLPESTDVFFSTYASFRPRSVRAASWPLFNSSPGTVR
jgi:hypothetical protein